MITTVPELDLLHTDDLVAIGMRADAIRKVWHPEGFITYSIEPFAPSPESGEVALVEEGLLERLAEIHSRKHRIVRLNLPAAGSTAVESLKLIALARIYLSDVPEIEIAGSNLGLKFCQIALRFGINDLGNTADGFGEEQIRMLIRDAGLVPKRRSANYSAYEVS